MFLSRSTIYELTLLDVKCKNLIPIGRPLDPFTSLKVRDHRTNETIQHGIGELFIESTVRQCVIQESGQSDGETSSSIATGDLVEIKSGTDIFYKTRTNDMVKIFGRKVNLTKIENAVKMCRRPISDACCVYDRDANSLHLFVQCRDDGGVCTKKELLRELRQKLLEQEVPNDIHFVDAFPLSCHGKISKSKLLQTIEKPTIGSPRDYFVTKLEENLPGFDLRQTFKLSFLAAGGTSVLALQLVNELAVKFNVADPELVPMLLNHDISLERVSLRLRTHSSNKSFETVSEPPRPLPFEWCHDLEKCIDATPTICTVDNRTIVSVGSHSHILVNVDVASGQLVSKVTLPHRIECQVVQHDDHGLVGCYDGFVYCFDIRGGSEKWKFDSKGMVKSRMCVFGGVLVFGNYNSEANLYALCVDDGSLIWSAKIGEKSIYAGIVPVTSNKLFVGTLDGVCAVVDATTGNTLWKTKLQSPIFSTPTIQGKFIFVAEVLGIVHCMDADSGTIQSSFQATGNIYSSIESIAENLLCFGCYDKFVYCLSFHPDAMSFELLWKSETAAHIFATPKAFTIGTRKLIVACGTSGQVAVLNLNGDLAQEFRVEGEIFSTPALTKGRSIIASRNNLLYCVDFCKILDWK